MSDGGLVKRGWDSEFRAGKKKMKGFLDKAKAKKMTEANREALEVLEFYGTPVASFQLVRSKEEIFKAGEEMGYPLVLKSLTSKVIHKGDIGAVLLNVERGDVPKAYASVLGNVATRMPWLTVPAIIVQEMVVGDQVCNLMLEREVEKPFPFSLTAHFFKGEVESATQRVVIKDEKELEELIASFWSDEWEGVIHGTFTMWLQFPKVRRLEVDAVYGPSSPKVVDAKFWLFPW